MPAPGRGRGSGLAAKGGPAPHEGGASSGLPLATGLLRPSACELPTVVHDGHALAAWEGPQWPDGVGPGPPGVLHAWRGVHKVPQLVQRKERQRVGEKASAIRRECMCCTEFSTRHLHGPQVPAAPDRASLCDLKCRRYRCSAAVPRLGCTVAGTRSTVRRTRPLLLKLLPETRAVWRRMMDSWGLPWSETG